MKNIKFPSVYLVILCSILLYCTWLFLPKSCENKPSGLQVKSDRSLKADSIQKRITDSVIFTSNAKIRMFEDSIKTLRSKNEKLSINYYALRAKIKHLPTVKVDSSYNLIGGTIIDTISLNRGPFMSNNLYISGLPIYQYNALINSGTMCDSLLMYQDAELMLKDSIISVREIQVDALKKSSEITGQALSDLIALNNEERKAKEKAQKLNKKIPLIGVICANIGALIAIFALK